MNTSLFFPPQASTFAQSVDALYFTLIGISSFFTIGIALTIFIMAARYRRRSPNQVGENVIESKRLELAWTVIPLLIVIGVYFWGAKDFMKTRNIPKDALQIAVVGKRWMWKIQHPDGRREINELHIPKGKPIHLKLISQDVIHSFFIPAFRIKQDAIPSFYTSIWFEATQTGEFPLFCAEYCGKDHSLMGGKVVVMEPAEYERWLSGALSVNPFYHPRSARPLQPVISKEPGYPENPVVQEGKKLFTQLACVSCHQVSGANGPSLQGLYGSRVVLASGGPVIADDNYLRESILNPSSKVVAGYSPIMPSFSGRVSEEEILSLIAYIRSLRSQP